MTSRLALATTVAAIVLGNTAGASAQTSEVTKLVPGSALDGVPGLGIDKSGRLFAGSVAGAALTRSIAIRTAKIAVPSPEGMADDIAFAPDGTMAWTGFLTGDLYSRKGDSPVKKLASGLPGLNSIAFRKDGRLYRDEVFLGDALYEIDVEGVKPPRKIMEKMGGLNGFESAGRHPVRPAVVQGPGRQSRHRQGRTRPSSPTASRFRPPSISIPRAISGWSTPHSASWCGSIRRPAAKKLVAQLKPSLDNLAIDDKDRIFVSNMADNGIQVVDPETGAAKQVRASWRCPAASASFPRTARTRSISPTSSPTVPSTALPARCPNGPHARRRRNAGISDERHRQGRRRAAVELVHRHGADDRPQDRQDREMLHDFKAPHDAVKLGDGSILVNELGSKSLVRASGEHGKDRTAVIGGLEGPVGLVAGSGGDVYLTEAFVGQVSKVGSQRREDRDRQGSQDPRRHRARARGKLIVAEVGAKRIIQIDPANGTITEIAANLPIGLPAAPGGLPSNIPTGVGVGATGVIYFSSDVENAIYKVVRK